MEQSEKQLSEKESLDLIAKMINRAKDSYNDTGLTAIMWGTVIAVCSLVKFSELQFNYRLPFDIYLLTIVAVIPQIFISRREKKVRKVLSYDSIYLDYIWLGFGIAVFLMIFIVNNITSGLDPLVRDYQQLSSGRVDWVDFHFSEFISPLFLLLYGIPTFITGAACRFKPMLWGGIFCWVCCVITIYAPIKVDLLLTAASAIMAWLYPGLLMKKEYDRYIKAHTTANV